MMYLSDKRRIELAIIPALIQYFLLQLQNSDKEVQEELISPMKIVNEYLQMLGFLTDNKPNKFDRRLERIIIKLVNYFYSQEFTTTKILLAVTAWAAELSAESKYLVDVDSRFYQLLDEIGEIIQKGYENVNDFKEWDEFAQSHIPAINKIAQAEGYYL